jgi:hypothetical protein
MTITLTKPTTTSAGADTVWGNKKVRVRILTFSGNYATGGETITAASLGLKVIEQVYLNGNLAVSTDLATANPVGVTIASTGASVVITQYEGAASGAAVGEKTDTEAYATGSNIRATFIGY